MLKSTEARAAHAVTVQRNYLAMIAALAGATCVGLTVHIIQTEQRVVLVPSALHQQVVVGTSQVDPEYVAAVGRDIAMVLMNRSPGTTDYINDVILRYAHPAHHGELRRQLFEIHQDAKARSVVSYFQPSNQVVDAPNLSVRFTGLAITMIGDKQVGRHEATIKLGFALDTGRLSWTHFEVSYE